jgi:hypothetical protein
MTSAGRDTSTISAGRADRDSEEGLERRTTASFGLWPWAELARHHGMTIAHFCELAGIEPSALRNLDVRFTQAVANRVTALAFEHFGCEAAMAAGMLVEAGQFNLLELIARTAPTVADGMEEGCRFFPLLHDGGKLVHEIATSGEHMIVWRAPDGYEVHHGLVELTFAVSVRGMRRETGVETFHPTAVWFTHAAPSQHALHEQLFGCPVQFGMPQDRLVVSAESAALPLARKNPEVHAAAADVANELLEE